MNIYNIYNEQHRRNHLQNNRPKQQRHQQSRTNSFTNLANKPRSRNNSHTALHDDRTSLLERVRQLETQLQTKPDTPATAPTIPPAPRRTTPNPPSHGNNGQSPSKATQQQQKNLTGAPSNSPGAPPQINDMLNYITATMETLNTFKQHLTTLQGTNPTHSEMC